jgi:HD-like signal output (HDOD) protein
MNNYLDISQDLIRAIENNELKLPTQPEVAVRIRDCAQDPNITPHKLAHVINHDPALTAKFIQIANSPLTRGAVPIDSLPQVINRLGLHFVCNIATGLAMEQIFQATNENIDNLMYEAWSSSTYVAAHAHVMAKNFSTVPSDTASLAGLMHQIGVLPILVYAQDKDDLAQNKPLLLQLIKEHHTKVGEAILKSWRFPQEICSLPQQLYQKYADSNDAPNLTHIVQAALLKTQEMKKNFIEIDNQSPLIYERLKLKDEEPLNEDIFQQELQESMKFYCQL